MYAQHPPHDARSILAILASLLLLFFFAPPARAHVADAPGANLRVDLYTYGPGDIYWERFGHDALVITDTGDGEAIAFNYGLFDFSEKDFFLNFARGRMTYMAAAWPAADDLAQYRGEGRWIVAQRLNLTPAQRASLRDFLVWNVQPQNARYAYDYYVSNCTTRVRDALDRVLGGALRAQLVAPLPRNETYRNETDRLMSGQPWLMLLLDLGLGRYADQPLNQWSGAFLPTNLMRELRGVRVANRAPLVESETQIAAARLPAPPATPPDLRAPMLGAGLILGPLFALCGYARRTSHAARIAFASLGAAYALLAGLAGWLMLILWTLTAHRAAWANENLLLFDPLALLLIPGLLRLSRRDAHISRFAFALTCALAALAAFALLSKALPWFTQRNLPWVLCALPMWLGLAFGLQRARR